MFCCYFSLLERMVGFLARDKQVALRRLAAFVSGPAEAEMASGATFAVMNLRGLQLFFLVLLPSYLPS